MTTTASSSEILRPRHIQTMLNVSRAQVYLLIHSGRLESIKISEKAYGVRREALTAYLAKLNPNNPSEKSPISINKDSHE
jgi:excisionase family DNA binding protein